MTNTMAITLALAIMLMGEAGIVGVEGAELVGEVAMNRTLRPNLFSDDLMEVIEHGFYGRENPSQAFIEVAENLLTDYTPNKDGYLYVINEDDRIKLLFPPGDLVFGEQLHLYYQWPEDKKKRRIYMSGVTFEDYDGFTVIAERAEQSYDGGFETLDARFTVRVPKGFALEEWDNEKPTGSELTVTVLASREIPDTDKDDRF